MIVRYLYISSDEVKEGKKVVYNKAKNIIYIVTYENIYDE